MIYGDYQIVATTNLYKVISGLYMVISGLYMVITILPADQGPRP